MITTAMETVWKFLKILKISYDLAIALLSIYPKEMKAGPQKVIFTPIIIHSSYLKSRSSDEQSV